MRYIIRQILPYIARLHWSNWRQERWGYPQLWGVTNKIVWKISGRKYRQCKRVVEWVCGFLTGHELSKTEWGYGGGRYIDRHCRWCDRLFKIPKQEENLPKVFGELIDEFDEDQEAFNL